MHDSAWLWIMFGMFFWVFLIPRRRFAACQGHRDTEERGEDVDRRPRRGGRAGLEDALAERDALIARLEERVRVLERIATGDSARLRAEIDALRDTPPGRS